MRADLEEAWEVLAEPIQTVMRKVGTKDAYERLKDLTRGSKITQDDIRVFVQNLGLPPEDEARLLALTPAAYTGLSAKLARLVNQETPASS
jgi:adenylosuccinate lyase